MSAESAAAIDTVLSSEPDDLPAVVAPDPSVDLLARDLAVAHLLRLTVAMCPSWPAADATVDIAA